MNLHIRHSRQRGAGSLIVVLVLFFVLSFVAAYSSRNMIFEQKVSANFYRSTQAFETANAGVSWALAMLNAGRIDDACTPTNAGGVDTFRQRYITTDANSGAMSARVWMNAGAATPLDVLCVRAGAGWSCSCPSNGAPVLAAPGGTDAAPAFRLRLNNNAGGRAGVIGYRVRSCTRLDTVCLSEGGSGQMGFADATATIAGQMALKGAISTPPVAALTSGGNINFGGAAVRVGIDNAPFAPVTLIARQGIAMGGAIITSLPGSDAADSIFENEGSVQQTGDLLFTSIFGMRRSTYQQQPGAVVLTCPADCGAADLQAVVARNPGRVLWLQGDLALDAPGDIGSAASPVVMVVNGNFTATAAGAGARIYGLVYIFNAGGQWVTGGSPTVQGAVVSEGAVSGVGTPQINYDFDVLNRLRLFSGSFVLVPGGWQQE